MNPQLLAFAIQQAPALIDTFKRLFREAHPDAPEPTDADYIAGLQSALTSSLAVDAAWLAAHPPIR